MATLKNLGAWGDAHHPKWLDIIRVALGVFIFWKGIFFIQHPEILHQAMKTIHLELFAAHYVAPIHLFGGLLIAVGLLTRISSFLQLPIVISVIIAFFIRGMGGFELWSSLVVLVLLIVFLVVGSGTFSVDAWIKKGQKQPEGF